MGTALLKTPAHGLKRFRPDVVFGFSECAVQAAALAKVLRVEFRTISVHRFPDGESRVTVPGSAKRPIIFRPLHDPNAKLIEVLLAASVLRCSRPAAICLLAPYLPYMRQDKAFRAGEAVSQKEIGRLLASTFDRFVTVDPHLHRTPTLAEVFDAKPALALSGALPMADHLTQRARIEDAIIIGPDVESAPLVRAFAARAKLPWAAARKKRGGDRNVAITLPRTCRVKDRPVIVVDDVISSGTTIAVLARKLRAAGARMITVYTTHALYDPAADRAMRAAGVDRTYSCDGIPHPSNAISLAPVLAEGLRQWR